MAACSGTWHLASRVCGIGLDTVEPFRLCAAVGGVVPSEAWSWPTTAQHHRRCELAMAALRRIGNAGLVGAPGDDDFSRWV